MKVMKIKNKNKRYYKPLGPYLNPIINTWTERKKERKKEERKRTTENRE